MRNYPTVGSYVKIKDGGEILKVVDLCKPSRVVLEGGSIFNLRGVNQVYQMFFNTGVRPENRLSLSSENKGKLVLSEHEFLKGGTIQIAYYLAEKPKENYRLLWLQPSFTMGEIPPYQKAIKIVGGGMHSDYAIFQVL